MFPFHHGDSPPEEGRNFLQQFNDSEAGLLIANVLHSLGALFFIAGIALYLYLAHSIRRARRDGANPHVGVLSYAHGFTLVGIGMNGVGGLMRLWESDHPGLDRLGDSVWVQVLLVKHLFLIAGIGLAAWLTFRTYRFTRGTPDYEGLHRESPRMVGFAVGSIATIVVATLLGAVASNVDLTADLGLAAETGIGSDDGMPQPGPESPSIPPKLDTEGVITGTPAQPGFSSHSFTVALPTQRMHIGLLWTSPAAVLAVTAIGPDEKPVEGQASTTSTSFNLTIEGGIPAGDWTLQVRTERAVNEAYTLSVRTGLRGNVIERTVTVLPNENFFEANLVVERGQSLTYDWYVVDSSGQIHFDIHLHEGNDVIYPVSGEWNRLNGTYVHASDNEGASLLWQNNQTTPVKVHYVVWGDFRVDSYSPPSRDEQSLEALI